MTVSLLFRVCLCGAKLKSRSSEHAQYVRDGRPVCLNCYMVGVMGPESDWDCPPEQEALARLGEFRLVSSG